MGYFSRLHFNPLLDFLPPHPFPFVVQTCRARLVDALAQSEIIRANPPRQITPEKKTAHPHILPKRTRCSSQRRRPVNKYEVNLSIKNALKNALATPFSIIPTNPTSYQFLLFPFQSFSGKLKRAFVTMYRNRTVHLIRTIF